MLAADWSRGGLAHISSHRNRAQAGLGAEAGGQFVGLNRAFLQWCRDGEGLSGPPQADAPTEADPSVTKRFSDITGADEATAQPASKVRKVAL